MQKLCVCTSERPGFLQSLSFLRGVPNDIYLSMLFKSSSEWHLFLYLDIYIPPSKTPTRWFNTMPTLLASAAAIRFKTFSIIVGATGLKLRTVIRKRCHDLFHNIFLVITNAIKKSFYLILDISSSSWISFGKRDLWLLALLNPSDIINTRGHLPVRTNLLECKRKELSITM